MLNFTKKLFSATGIFRYTGCKRRDRQQNLPVSWQ